MMLQVKHHAHYVLQISRLKTFAIRVHHTCFLVCGFTCPAQFFVIYCLNDHWNDIINVKNDTEGQGVAQNTNSKRLQFNYNSDTQTCISIQNCG